jgi:protein SCO1/2
MKSNRLLSTIRAVFALALCTLSFGAFAGDVQSGPPNVKSMPVPADSVYQLQSALTDQDGKTFKLDRLRGKPVIVSMFYNSCQFVCPMLIDTLKMTSDAAGGSNPGGLSYLLVTFDPARDDVAVLRSVAKAHALDTTQWTLARTDAASVRKLAAVLHIQYRLLANGDFNHSTALILLDREGRIIGRSDKLGAVDPEFLDLVKHALQDE